MDHDIDFKIGDLVYVVNDCYIFSRERARVTKTGGVGVVVKIEHPSSLIDKESSFDFWPRAIKIEFPAGISGWILKENLVLMCDKDG